MRGWYTYMNVARRAIDALDALDANANSAPLFGSHGPSAAAIKAIAGGNPTSIGRNWNRRPLPKGLNSCLVRPTTLCLVDSSPIFAGAKEGVL